MQKKGVVFFIFLLFLTMFLSISFLSAADLFVPTMEMITRGYVDASSFVLDTRGTFELAVAGGYKIGGNIMVSIESDDLASLNSPPALSFTSAHVIARNLFTLPINLSYFVGEYETFGNGDVFFKQFGTVPVASKYRGYIYFPEGIRYDGIYNPTGTGIEIETSEDLFPNLQLAGYIYQDSYLGKGYYSSDLRTILNLELFKLEGFVGYSFPVARYGYFRGGVLLYYNTGIGGEFLMQVGIPLWDPSADPLSINLFYFFFEPRVNFNIFSIIITLFWHPSYYQQQTTGELGNADINIDFRAGDLVKNPYAGGLETTLKFQTADTATEQISLSVSPYFRAVTTGIIWTFKINMNLVPFNVSEMFEGFIGVKAEF